MKQVTCKLELTERYTGKTIYKLCYNNQPKSKAVEVSFAEYKAANVVRVPLVRYINTSTLKGLKQAERLQARGWSAVSINPVTNVIKLVN